MTETHHPSHSTPVTIIKTVLIDSWVHLYGCPQDGWWLYWSDGVVNDWTEHYTELSHAQLLATTTTDPRSPRSTRRPS